MPSVIYKYPITTSDNQTIKLPADAQILSVQVQHDTVQMWALLPDKDAIPVERVFALHGTGHIIKDSSYYHYISTFQIYRGNLVFHLFEVV